MKKINRKQPQAKSTRKSLIFGVITIVVLVVSYLLYRSTALPATIAEVRETTTTCTSNISTFTAQGACTNGQVNLVEYNCTGNGQMQRIGGPSGCVDIKSAFAEAQKTCGQTCSTPSPSFTSGQPTPPTPPDQKPMQSPPPSMNPPINPAPAEPTTPITKPSESFCTASLNKWSFKESCGVDMYRYVEFTCGQGQQTQVFGSSSSCKTSRSWLEEARTTCSQTLCSDVPPNYKQQEVPKPIKQTNTVKHSYATCFKTCRTTDGRPFLQCATSCLR